MTFPALTHPDAGAWRADAAVLAAWADAELVNRRDVWGAYIPPARRTAPDRKSWTAPPTAARGTVTLTRGRLASHFAGAAVLGVHALSRHDDDGRQVCRWLAFDLDAHDDATAGAAAAANRAAATRLVRVLADAGAVPLLELSCDRGGVHVWCRFDVPADSRAVHAFALGVQRAAGVTGETFPKQPATARDGFGNWLRLPGPHHSRPWWSRIVTDTGDELAGADAARAVLAWRATPAAIIPPAPVPTPAPVVVRPWAPVHSGGDPLARLRAYVARIPRGLRHGDRRSDTAYRLAARALADLTEGETVALVGAWNRELAEPMSDDDVRRIVGNAAKYRRGVA